MDVKPDGFIGMIMAIEGITDATVLLHGPDGCRKNLTALSERCFPRPSGDVDVSTPYYRGMRRIPCTSIGSNDYIHGAYTQVRDALSFLNARGAGFVAVVCSPGTSLIGDDIGRAIRESGMQGRAVSLDAGLSSEPLNIGMDLAAVRILEALSSVSDRTAGRVNLLGANILMKDWPTVVEEFSHILGLMGLEVACPLCAGSSLGDIGRFSSSEFNVVLCPEYATETAKHCERVLGIPSVGLPYAPVGFDATEDLIREVARFSGRDPEMALKYVGRFRRRAYRCMTSANRSLRGDSFAIDADPSVAYPLAKMMYEDLGMVPVSIRFNGKAHRPSQELMEGFLNDHGLADVLQAEPPERVDALFCEGNTARLEHLSGHAVKGVDISFPSMMNVDFRPSPVLGPSGALYLLESVVNPPQQGIRTG